MSSEYKFGDEALNEILSALGIGHIECLQRLIFTAGEKDFPIVYLQFAPNADMMEALGKCEAFKDAGELEMRRIYETTGYDTHLEWIERASRKAAEEKVKEIFDRLNRSSSYAPAVGKVEVNPEFDDQGQDLEGSGG